MKPEVFLPDDYRPAEDEPFMNERQLEYFRRKLFAWKEELLEQSAETLEGLQDSARSVPDIADRDVFVCGPEPWAEQVRRSALAAGVPADRFHVESFGW